jgi:hypothetical protein
MEREPIPELKFCGFKPLIVCDSNCRWFSTCTRNPHKKEKQQKKAEVVKDRECVSCSKIFDCKGKPRGVRCINYDKRKNDGRN